MVDNPSLYREVLDTIYDGVYFLDRQRKIFFWNKGAERITGYRAAEVMGRSCADNILCHVDKQGRNLCRDGCPAADLLNDGQHREAEVYLLHKNGYRKPVRIRVAPIEDASGRVEGVMEIFSDDTSPESLRRRVALLEKLSALDPLTQLPNRRSMEATLRPSISITSSVDTHGERRSLLRIVAKTWRAACGFRFVRPLGSSGGDPQCGYRAPWRRGGESSGADRRDAHPARR